MRNTSGSNSKHEVDLMSEAGGTSSSLENGKGHRKILVSYLQCVKLVLECVLHLRSCGEYPPGNTDSDAAPYRST